MAVSFLEKVRGLKKKNNYFSIEAKMCYSPFGTEKKAAFMHMWTDTIEHIS